MSQTVIFEIGAVIFVAVAAAVFLYGFMLFGSFQQPDDEPGLAVEHATNGVLQPAEKSEDGARRA